MRGGGGPAISLHLARPTAHGGPAPYPGGGVPNFLAGLPFDQGTEVEELSGVEKAADPIRRGSGGIACRARPGVMRPAGSEEAARNKGGAYAEAMEEVLFMPSGAWGHGLAGFSARPPLKCGGGRWGRDFGGAIFRRFFWRPFFHG